MKRFWTTIAGFFATCTLLACATPNVPPPTPNFVDIQKLPADVRALNEMGNERFELSRTSIHVLSVPDVLPENLPKLGRQIEGTIYVQAVELEKEEIILPKDWERYKDEYVICMHMCFGLSGLKAAVAGGLESAIIETGLADGVVRVPKGENPPARAVVIRPHIRDVRIGRALSTITQAETEIAFTLDLAIQAGEVVEHVSRSYQGQWNGQIAKWFPKHPGNSIGYALGLAAQNAIKQGIGPTVGALADILGGMTLPADSPALPRFSERKVPVVIDFHCKRPTNFSQANRRGAGLIPLLIASAVKRDHIATVLIDGQPIIEPIPQPPAVRNGERGHPEKGRGYCFAFEKEVRLDPGHHRVWANLVVEDSLHPVVSSRMIFDLEVKRGGRLYIRPIYSSYTGNPFGSSPHFDNGAINLVAVYRE